jgi:Flp pilus assembly protein TadG
LGIYLRLLRRFRRDERGVILILFTLLIVPLMLIVGVAIDFSQTLVVKRQLTAAVDAAALAIGAEPQLDDEEAEQKAEAFIRAHYPEAALGALKSFNVVRDADTIDVSATATIDTSFLRIAGFNTLDVTVNNRVIRKQTKLEVVMVLDNTGSMGTPPSKLAALKTAANGLVDVLFGDKEDSAYVKIGLVPFANAVNVGSSHRGAPWLDEANPTDLNREHVRVDGGFKSLFQIFDQWKKTWNGCVRSRDGFDLTDTTPSAADKRTLFTPYFAPDENFRNANSYFSGDTELYKLFSYYKNKPAPVDSIAGGPGYGCPAPIQDLTNVKSTVTSAISAMVAKGSTVLPEGIAWGWRVISPGEPFTAGAPYTDQDTIKAVILMTDGDNNINSRQNGDYKSIFSSYGFAANGHLGSVDGAQAWDVLNQKTAQLCSNIKADKDGDGSDQDILVYSIVFNVGAGTKAESLMRDCASDESKFFNSSTGDELANAFKDIALGLSKLRVGQ